MLKGNNFDNFKFLYNKYGPRIYGSFTQEWNNYHETYQRLEINEVLKVTRKSQENCHYSDFLLNRNY